MEGREGINEDLDLLGAQFFEHLGFEIVDRAGEFVLLARRLIEGASEPRFAKAVHGGGPSTGGRFVARYTDQCPFNLHWAAQMSESIRARGYDVDIEHLTRRRDAQRVRSPLGTFGLERDGALVTHHLQTDNGVGRLLERM